MHDHGILARFMMWLREAPTGPTAREIDASRMPPLGDHSQRGSRSSRAHPAHSVVCPNVNFRRHVHDVDLLCESGLIVATVRRLRCPSVAWPFRLPVMHNSYLTTDHYR